MTTRRFSSIDAEILNEEVQRLRAALDAERAAHAATKAELEEYRQNAIERSDRD